MRTWEISNKAPLSLSSSKVSLCCAICGLVFERYAAWAKKSAVHYCGRACKVEGQKIVVDCTCVVCGATYQSNPSNAARVVTCSRRCHRIKKVKHQDTLSDRMEAKQARDDFAASATHCDKCGGQFGPEVRCVEGLGLSLAPDGVTVLVDQSDAKVLCRPCHMENCAPRGVDGRKRRPRQVGGS